MQSPACDWQQPKRNIPHHIIWTLADSLLSWNHNVMWNAVVGVLFNSTPRPLAVVMNLEREKKRVKRCVTKSRVSPYTCSVCLSVRLGVGQHVRFAAAPESLGKLKRREDTTWRSSNQPSPFVWHYGTTGWGSTVS